MRQRVYIMVAQGVRKIGMSADAHARAKQLAREAKCGVELVWQSETTTDAWKIEATAHKLLWADGFHERGEWFRAPHDRCIEAIEAAARIVAGLDEAGVAGQIVGSSKRGFRWKTEKWSFVTIKVDARVKDALDDIRAMRRPVPTISEAIRQAILNERDALKRKMAAQERK